MPGAVPNALRPRRLTGTDLEVTPVAAGGAVLASMPRAFRYDVPEERALATIRAVLRGPLNFLDTAAGYGRGESERRIGIALREAGGLPPGFVISTKVDPDPATGDYSGSQALRSAEQSLARLGLDQLQLLHLHDPERITFERAMAPDGPVEAMLRLQREGVVRHLGVAGGPIDLLRRFVATGAFGVVLTHNRYTLVDRSAAPLIEEASRAGVGVLNAAVYGGGILAKGPEVLPTYAYREVGAEVCERIERMDRSAPRPVCRCARRRCSSRSGSPASAPRWSASPTRSGSRSWWLSSRRRFRIACGPRWSTRCRPRQAGSDDARRSFGIGGGAALIGDVLPERVDPRARL